MRKSRARRGGGKEGVGGGVDRAPPHSMISLVMSRSRFNVILGAMEMGRGNLVKDALVSIHITLWSLC